MNVVESALKNVGSSSWYSGQRHLARRDRAGDVLEVGLHRRHQLGGLGDVAGDGAELLDLGVGVVERRSPPGPPTPRAERLRAGSSAPAARTSRRGRARSRRSPRRSGSKPGEVGPHGLGLGRVVGLVVDGDDLVAGADGEQHLRRRRRQRHDALRDVAGRRRRRRVVGAVDARPSMPVGGAVGSARRSPVAVAADVVAAASPSSSSPPQPAANSGQAGDDAGESMVLVDTVPPSSWRTSARQRLREPPLASRVWLSPAGPGDRTRPPPLARAVGGFTVAGQCRALTGLRWVLRPPER